MSELRNAGLFIDGRVVSGEGEAFSNLDPATGRELGTVFPATPAQLDEAVGSAREAFKTWSAKSPTERGRVLLRAGRLLRARLESLAELETRDSGKAIAETRAVDIPSSADALEFFGGVVAGLKGDYHDFGSSFAYTRREPLGVCAGIGAWNYPIQIASWKAAPALAAGNTMVLKPSELTPLTTLLLAEVLVEAGLPKGAFNVVQGTGEVGRALCRHPGVAKVSLTGSVPTGLSAMAGAAESMKSVTLELGGKSPLLIFADAPLEQAVYGALLANYFTQGEVCTNGTRVFVEDGIYDRFVEALLPRVAALRVGDPLDPRTQMGALISRRHLEKVLGYIELGKREGARLLYGGRQPRWEGASQHLSGGNFLTPAVFVEVEDGMSIARDEIFGPVMSVFRFKSEEEVVERANATEYGLAAGVFTRDLQRAHRVVARLDAGFCWIGNYGNTPVEVPFGGMKKSGLGRENGLVALDQYTRVKTVYVEMGEMPDPFPIPVERER